jgi:multimeric flavodoxin WrbA
MARLLIVWWSMTGGTRQLAQAAADGARRQAALPDQAVAVDVSLLAAEHAGAPDVLDADGYLFATPENLGSMAGMMKDFFDRTYYPALERVAGRPWAAIVCAGSDGQGAARQLERIATGWRLRRVAEPLIVITHAQTPEAILAPKIIPAAQLEQAAELGAGLAAGLALGIW